MLCRRIVLCLVSLLAFASILPAEPPTFELDTQATTIEFTFGATLHTVDGTLRAKEGKIYIQPETGSRPDFGQKHRSRSVARAVGNFSRFPGVE